MSLNEKSRRHWMVGLATVCVLASTQLSMADKTSDILATYSDIALAGYEDSLKTAIALDQAVESLIRQADEETLDAARKAWIDARIPYQQTEVFRFGNPVVDEWEGRVNAWPLDEGLIDYVVDAYGEESDENTLFRANVVANKTITINGEKVDVSTITPDILSGVLQEAGGVEANVATGYHAIEFLLWGQDTNGTGPGAGDRPYSDYDSSGCINGNCERRASYLAAASDLLVADLEEMVDNWKPGGAAREALLQGAPAAGLSAILTGMGSLSYGELAGERMKLGLLLHDPEEEHDCFSDNTHASHYYDALGIRNIYLARYQRVDGSSIDGASISDAVRSADRTVDAELRARLDHTMAAMETLRARADSGESYDQMIAEGNVEGNAVVQAAIDALIDQTRSIERAIAALELSGIELEGSDSLSSPGSVFE